MEYRAQGISIPEGPYSEEYKTKAGNHNSVIATPNHPFWVVARIDWDEGSGYEYDKAFQPQWVSLENLELNDMLLLAEGQLVTVFGLGPIWKTTDPYKGWHQAQYGKWKITEDNLGNFVEFYADRTVSKYMWDLGYLKGEYVPPKLCDSIFETDKYGDFYPYLTTVYNIEVEDHHTYYVGEFGVWVHNQNCYEKVQTPKKQDTFFRWVLDAEKFKLSPTKAPGVFGGRTQFEDALPASKKMIGAMKESDVKLPWSKLQAAFDGSLTIAANGVQTLYAYTLGYNNPFLDGRTSIAMGDGLAHIYQNGKRLASNLLVDTKMAFFGAKTDAVII